MRRQVKSNHRKESRAPPLVKAIDGQFDAIDVMASCAQKLWSKTAPAKAVYKFGKQGDAFPCCQRRGQKTEERHHSNQDEHLFGHRRHRVSEEHQARAAKNYQYY